MLLIQCLSLYLQLYAKSNFNIVYTYMLNVFMLQLCSKRRTVTQVSYTLRLSSYDIVNNIMS